MNTYLTEISRITLLSREEEHDLAVQVRAQCTTARDAMVKANLRLVVSLARGFRGRGLSFPDLVAEGNVGLIRAVDRFDPDRGCRFSTYGAWWIRQSMLRAISQKTRTVRIPNDLVELVWRFKRRASSMAAESGRQPRFEEVAEALELPRSMWKRVKDALAAAKGTVPLSTTEDEGPDATTLTPDPKAEAPSDAAEKQAQKDQLRRVLNRLRPRESAILRMRFGLDGIAPMTLKQVGLSLSISRERVRQLERVALNRLHEHLDPKKNEGDEGAPRLRFRRGRTRAVTSSAA